MGAHEYPSIESREPTTLAHQDVAVQLAPLPLHMLRLCILDSGSSRSRTVRLRSRLLRRRHLFSRGCRLSMGIVGTRSHIAIEQAVMHAVKRQFQAVGHVELVVDFAQVVLHHLLGRLYLA